MDEGEDVAVEYVDNACIYIVDKVVEDLPFPRLKFIKNCQVVVL